MVVPTLDEEGAIGALLDVVALVRGVTEVIVVDGGSRDATVSIAGDHGVRVLEAVGGGRGAQMRAGAAVAGGEALLFLHADTLPPIDAAEALTEALAWPWVAGGNFFTRFSGRSRAARFMTWLYPQLHKLGIVYGDSAIFVRASTYRAAGGFRSLPIFEDLDLVRRLRRHGRIVHLPSAVMTSSRRFEGRSFPWMLVRWIVMQVLYWLGVPPGRLARLYAPVREPGRGRARRGAAGSSSVPGGAKHASPIPLCEVSDDSRLLGEVRDPDGRVVVLFVRIWEEKIIRDHPELVDQLEPVLATVSTPDHAEPDPRAARRRYYRRRVGPSKWLLVVVSFEQVPGRIISALATRKDPKRWKP